MHALRLLQTTTHYATPTPAPVSMPIVESILTLQELPILNAVLHNGPTHEDIELAYEWDDEINTAQCGCGASNGGCTRRWARSDVQSRGSK